jgi:hypothetical protein
MIDDGPLAELIPKTGEEFIRLPGGGRIDTSPRARSRGSARASLRVPAGRDRHLDAGNGHGEGRRDPAPRPRRHGRPRRGDTNGWDPSRDRSRSAPPRRRRATSSATTRSRRSGCRTRTRRSAARSTAASTAAARGSISTRSRPRPPSCSSRTRARRSASSATGSSPATTRRSTSSTTGRSRAPGDRAGPQGHRRFDGSIRWDHTGLVVTDIETGHQAVVAGGAPGRADRRRRVARADRRARRGGRLPVHDVGRVAAERRPALLPRGHEPLGRQVRRRPRREWWTANRKKTAPTRCASSVPTWAARRSRRRCRTGR